MESQTPQLRDLERKPGAGAPESPIWRAFEVQKTYNPETISVSKKGVCIYCSTIVFGAPKWLYKHIQQCKLIPSNTRATLLAEQLRWWKTNPWSLSSEHSSEIRNNDDGVGGSSRHSLKTVHSFIPIDDADRTNALKEALVMATIEANATWSLLDSKYFRKFCHMLDPTFVLPSRSQATRNILSRVYETKKQQISEFIQQSKWISIAFDGWKNVSRDPLVNVMVIGDKHRTELYTIVNTKDISQNSENIVEFLEKDVIEKIGYSKINAIVTDSAANYVRAKRQLTDKYSTIIAVPCLSHELNLLVGDLIQHDSLKDVITKATAIITYFRSSSLALQCLRGKCGKEKFSFEIPTLTRWNSFYKSLSQLREREIDLKRLAANNDDDGYDDYDDHNGHVDNNNVGNNNVRGEFKINSNVSDIINDVSDTFWKQLHAITNIIKPFSYAPIILESHTATLADAVFIWAQLQLQTMDNKHRLNNDLLYHHILRRIHIRWKKVYNIMFIITFFLHPHYFDSGENIHDDIIPTLRVEACNLYARLFNVRRTDKEVERFLEQLILFSGRLKTFGDPCIWDPIMTNDPIIFWENLARFAPELSKFAIRLLSIPPTSADAERLWSVMSNIHTERRNRLTNERAIQMATISWYISREKNQVRREKILENLMNSFDEINNDYNNNDLNNHHHDLRVRDNNTEQYTIDITDDDINGFEEQEGDDDGNDISRSNGDAIGNEDIVMIGDNVGDEHGCDGNSIQIASRNTLAALSTVRSTVQIFDEEYETANMETKDTNRRPAKHSGRKLQNEQKRRKTRFAYVQVDGRGDDDNVNDGDYDERDDRVCLNGPLNLQNIRNLTCSIFKRRV